MTTDWMGLIVQGIAICFTIGAPIGAGLIKLNTKVAVLGNEVSELKSRLGGNGESVPTRCGVHDNRLETLEKRMDTLHLAGGE